jgi:hypothetical protein
VWVLWPPTAPSDGWRVTWAAPRLGGFRQIWRRPSSTCTVYTTGLSARYHTPGITENIQYKRSVVKHPQWFSDKRIKRCLRDQHQKASSTQVFRVRIRIKYVPWIWVRIRTLDPGSLLFSQIYIFFPCFLNTKAGRFSLYRKSCKNVDIFGLDIKKNFVTGRPDSGSGSAWIRIRLASWIRIHWDVWLDADQDPFETNADPNQSLGQIVQKDKWKRFRLKCPGRLSLNLKNKGETHENI